MLDFSNADDQREFAQGPVPAGSIVVVEMEVLEPKAERQAQENRFISVAQSGLRQIYCKFEVTKGTYAGVSFRQNVTLPSAAQTISLSPNQEKACNIGNAMLKAMCLAAGKPTKVRDVQGLSGMRFPVRVKINSRPSETNDGRIFWNNEIAFIITPDREEYAKVRQAGEIIVNGPVTGGGTLKNPSHAANSNQDVPPWEDVPPPAENYDDVPF